MRRTKLLQKLQKLLSTKRIQDLNESESQELQRVLSEYPELKNWVKQCIKDLSTIDSYRRWEKIDLDLNWVAITAKANFIYDDILHIDDDEMVLTLSSYIAKDLGIFGSAFMTFMNAQSALNWIDSNSNKKVFILLDLNMPVVSGWDFLDLLEERKHNLEIVILTSSIDPRDIERSSNYKSVIGYEAKPLYKPTLERYLKHE